jgi:iron complex transport system substrate-binding protein
VRAVRSVIAIASIILPAAIFLLLSKTASPNPAPIPPYQRVVSLSPSLSRIAADLDRGNSIIGTTSYDFTFGNKAIVGSIVDPSVEKIVSLHPDLVISSEEDGAVQRSESLGWAGITTVILPQIRSFEQILDCYIKTGELLGVKEAAVAKADSYRKSLVKTASSGIRTVFLLSHDPLIAASKNSFMGEIISDAGGICAVEGFGNPYPIISREYLMSLNVQCVITVVEGKEDELYAAFSSFSSIPFIKNRSVHFISPEIACYYTPADYIRTRDMISEFISGTEKQ